MIKIKNDINETTQVSDVGTYKKAGSTSTLPFLQVKFNDYNTAQESKDSIFNLITTVTGIPKNHIKMDTSHMDKHTSRYSRPITVSYSLESAVSVLNIDKSIALKGVPKLKSEIESMKGVTKVFDLVTGK